MTAEPPNWDPAYFEVLVSVLLFALGIPLIALQTFVSPEHRSFLQATLGTYLRISLLVVAIAAILIASALFFGGFWSALAMILVMASAMAYLVHRIGHFGLRQVIEISERRWAKGERRGEPVPARDVSILGDLASRSRDFEAQHLLLSALARLGTTLVSRPELHRPAIEPWRMALRQFLLGNQDLPADHLKSSLEIVADMVRRLVETRSKLYSCRQAVLISEVDSHCKGLRDLRRAIAETLVTREPKLAEVAIGAVDDDVEALLAIGKFALWGRQVLSVQSAIFHLLRVNEQAESKEARHLAVLERGLVSHRDWPAPDVCSHIRAYSIGLTSGLAAIGPALAGWSERVVLNRVAFPTEPTARYREFSKIEQELMSLSEYSAADDVAAWRQRLAERDTKPKTARNRRPEAKSPAPPPLDIPPASP
jgi:hypothetical protein